jgi:hypothetical protein
LKKIEELFAKAQVEREANIRFFTQQNSPITAHLFLSVATEGVATYSHPTVTQLVGLLYTVAKVKVDRHFMPELNKKLFCFSRE